MKKLVAITVVAGLMIGLASAAMATGTATDWAMLFRGSDATTAWGSAAGLIQIGTVSTGGTIDGKDAKDVKYTANTGAQAQVVAYEPTFPDVPPYYNADKKAPITDTAKSWSLLFWVGSGYTQSAARLAWWATSTTTPINTGAALNWTYTVTIDSDPTGTYAAGTKWNFTPGAIGTQSTPVGYAEFSNIANIKLADAAAATSGVKLTVTAGPSAPVVTPEPSSMLALASGLFGLAGFSIRRRK